jgi:hypothetical protein
MLHMLQWLYMYVAKVCSKCFICFFRHKLQVCFLDVAYVSHICLQVILHMLAMAFKCFRCFASVLDIYCKCFICFRRTLQVFHLDVAKVDRVLHMLQCAWDTEGARAVPACGLAACATSERHGPCAGVRNIGAGVECRRKHGKRSAAQAVRTSEH